MRLVRKRFGWIADALEARRGVQLYYISPGVNWVLDWVGHYVTHGVRDQFGLKATVVKSAPGVSGRLIHYGSLWDSLSYFSGERGTRNRVISTIFHGLRDDAQFQDALGQMLNHATSFARIHTASRIMENRLLEWGVPRTQLVRIPLGVDLRRFTPSAQVNRARRRMELGIPEKAFCIGSFHKDGQGWDDGSEPKLIKGPDVFLETLGKLKDKFPIFVLLSAPARGFVKKGLEKLGIPYRHIVLRDFHDVPSLYAALDLYFIASREEGGPEGVLEALASGVPLVTTKVGLAPDVVTHGEDGLLANVEDADGLAEQIARLIDDSELRHKVVRQGLETIKSYDWNAIAARYYHEIYAPLLLVTR